MATIHPTALVDPKAQIDPSVTIGPYSVVGPDVCIGRGTRVGAHCVIEGQTRIGQDNQIFQFNSIGAIPQDKKYAGERSELHIGDGNTIREFCTINLGVQGAGGVTRIGNHNWIMAYCHIAHDCVVGNHTVFANNATLAGHVWIGDHTVLGGFTGVHQFVRVGAHVMAGVSSVILQDVPTYVTVAGHPCAPHGINSEGLKRRGYTPEGIAAIKRAYRTLYKSGLGFAEAKAELERQAAGSPEVKALADFLATSTRGIVR